MMALNPPHQFSRTSATLAPALFEAGGPLEPTPANFPNVCFWSCPQSDIGLDAYANGKGRLTDKMGVAHLVKATVNGLVQTPASPDGFSVFPIASLNGTTVDGAIPPPDGKIILFQSVAQYGIISEGNVLGDNVSAAGISHFGTNAISDDGGTSAFGVPFTLDYQVSGRATLIKSWDAGASDTTGMATFECAPGEPAVDLGDASTEGILEIAEWGSATRKWSCNSNQPKLYGMALMLLDSLPTDEQVRMIVQWHTYHWTQGNKWLCPLLRQL